MMRYQKYALFLLLMITYSTAFAQIKSRYVFGINLSTLQLESDNVTKDPNMVPGIHFGKIFEIPVLGVFHFEPGILFSSKGADYSIDSADISLSPIYLEVPVNFSLNFGSGHTKIVLFGGPYIGLGVGGIKLETGQALKDLKFGSGEGKDLTSFDFGFSFGLGVRIKKFMISAQYESGLTDISPEIIGECIMKNRVIGVTVSSTFTGNR